MYAGTCNIITSAGVHYRHVTIVMSTLTGELAKVNRPPENFQPKRSFGLQGKDRRSSRAEWYDTYHWLYYDASSDSAFCHVHAYGGRI